MGSRGDWREYNFDDVVKLIHHEAGDLNVKEYFTAGDEAKEKFDYIKSSVLSLIHLNFSSNDDKFLIGLIKKIESAKIFTEGDYIK